MRKVIIAFVALWILVIAGENAQCAEIDQVNNTEIIRGVFDANGCNRAPAFAEFRNLYYEHSSSKPTVCTIFIINPFRYNTITVQASSFVNLQTLLQAAQVEKVSAFNRLVLAMGAKEVSAVALFFVAPPNVIVDYAFSIPFSVNVTFTDRQGHIVDAPDDIKVKKVKVSFGDHDPLFISDTLSDSKVENLRGNTGVGDKGLGANVPAVNAVYLYTQDGGEDWHALYVENSSVAKLIN